MATEVPWKPILIVGGIGAGGYLIWKWFFEPEKDYEYWYNKLLKDLEDMQYWVDEYKVEFNEMTTMIDNWAGSGEPITAEREAELDAMTEEMKEKDKKLEIIWTDINEDDLPNLEPDGGGIDIDNPFQDLWDALGLGANIIIWGAVGTAVLYLSGFVFAAVSRIIKNWRDMNGGPPSASIPTSEGVVEVSGATVDDFTLNAITQFADYVINQSAVSVVVPNMEYMFRQLPTWQQDIIINESIMVAALAGRPNWTWAPNQNWLKQFEKPEENETLKYLVIGAIAAYMIIPSLAVAPEAIVLLEGIVGQGGLVLAPAAAAV